MIKRHESPHHPEYTARLADGVTTNPEISFGEPVVENTGIRTCIIAERFMSGETIAALVKDYGLKSSAIEKALRFELNRSCRCHITKG